MKDKLGTILGFLIGLSLITFGIIWPDNLSNYYVYQLVQHEETVQMLRDQRAPRAEIQAEIEKLEEFKNSWSASLFRFLDLKSFLIVFGGSYAAILIAFPFSKALRTFVFIAQVFSKDKLQEEFLEVYTTLITLGGKRASKDVITDDEISRIKNENLRAWVQDFIAVDLVSEEMIQEIIESEIEMYNYRSFEEIDVLEFMGKAAPAFGMVGTVVGLILMLSRAGGAGGSVTEIMGAMSVALITTLYGVLVAQLVFVPIASKRYQNKETNVKLLEMIQEGILYLKRRELPEVAGKDLIIYLPMKLRQKIQAEQQAAMRSGNLGL